MGYNWQQGEWRKFHLDSAEINDLLFAFAEETGCVCGLLNELPDNMQMEAFIDIMVAKTIKTSEIEGEYLSRKDIMSSIRNNLGLNQTLDEITDKASVAQAI